MDSIQVQIQPSSQGRSRSAHKASNTVRPTRDFLQLSSRYKTYEELKKKQAKVAGRILTYGLVDEEGKPPARPLLWKTMLGVLDLEVNRYLEWVKKGPSEFSEKIKNDTFRTMATDTQFKGKVKEEMLIILLEAFVWKSHDRQDGEMEFTYVQGMNVLAAPFLYAMPTQVEAFACFSTFIEEQCPLYVQPTLVGVHRGLELLDRCLEVIDPKMFHHLKSKHLKAQLYALPSVMTFCAATPPLEEVLKLWDFLFCHGAHLNILFVIAQMDLCSQDIMNSPSPMKVLRTLPPLNAESIIARTMIIIGKVPADLYEELIEHPYKPLDNRRSSSSSGSSISSRGW